MRAKARMRLCAYARAHTTSSGLKISPFILLFAHLDVILQSVPNPAPTWSLTYFKLFPQPVIHSG